MEQAEVINANTQDMTGFLPVEGKDHIWAAPNGKFWFVDETGDATGNGPYDDVDAAAAGLAAYVEHLNRENPELSQFSKLLDVALGSEGNPLTELMAMMGRSKLIAVTDEERAAKVAEAVESIYAHCEIGRQFDVAQWPDQEEAFRWAVSCITAANMSTDNDFAADLLMNKGIDCRTIDSTKALLGSILTHNAFDTVVSVDATTIYERPGVIKSFVDTCNEMWDVMEADADEEDAHPSHAMIVDRVSSLTMAILSVLSTSALATNGQKPDEVLLDFVCHWQAHTLSSQLLRSDKRGALREYLNSGLAAPLRTKDEALRYLAQAIVARRCTVRPEGANEPEQRHQAWEWNEVEADQLIQEASTVISGMLHAIQ